MRLEQQNLLPISDRAPMTDYVLDIRRENYQIVAPLQPWGLWQTDASIEVEIGSGNGHFIIQKALANPETLFVAVEISPKRIGKIYEKAAKRGIQNLKLVCADALAVFAHYVPKARLEAVYINFPDPWPKSRHSKKRVGHERLFADILKATRQRGHFYFVSDVDWYAKEVAATLTTDTRYRRMFETPIVTTMSCYPQSSYEVKWRALGRPIYYQHYCIEKTDD